MAMSAMTRPRRRTGRHAHQCTDSFGSNSSVPPKFHGDVVHLPVDVLLSGSLLQAGDQLEVVPLLHDDRAGRVPFRGLGHLGIITPVLPSPEIEGHVLLL